MVSRSICVCVYALILLVPLSYVDMFMEFTCIYYKFDIIVVKKKLLAIADRCTGLLFNRFAVEIWSSRWCYTFASCCCFFCRCYWCSMLVLLFITWPNVFHLDAALKAISCSIFSRIWIKNTKCQNRLLIDVNFYYVNIDTENLSICVLCYIYFFFLCSLLLSTFFFSFIGSNKNGNQISYSPYEMKSIKIQTWMRSQTGKDISLK